MSLLALALLACKPDPVEPDAPSPLLDVPETERFTVDGLTAPAHVIWTAHGVPRIYAENDVDLARVQGFIVARDRFFSMDLVRRLSTGRLSEVLGEVGLETDLESRGIGMTALTDDLLANLTPTQVEVFTAYAEGFNDYIAAVRAGDVPGPSEYAFAAPLIGVEDPNDLLVEWTLRDVAAIGGTIAYRLGFETGDIGRAADAARIPGLFDDAPFGALRQAGVEEYWTDVTPVFDVPSAPGFGAHGTLRSAGTPRIPRPARADRALVQRAAARGDRIQDRFGRDHTDGWGSNAWAVSSDFTADGRALLAGDGHLELDIPALMYQIGLDTEHLGGGDTHSVGTLLVGMPVLGVGTNGQVAWSSTQHSGDITDWYADRLQLDASGRPSATWFQGAWSPLTAVDESYVIADVPSLGSVGRTEIVTRWVTADGRWLFDVEGREAEADEPLTPGEARVNLAGTWIVPSDVDGDGEISAITFDFTGFDRGNLFLQYDAYAHAGSIADLHEATRMSQALSQNTIAADARGDVFYTGYEMVPCRGYLPRDPDGGWADGADPTLLLDGSVYGGFTMPTNDDFTADESSTDPYRCVVPFAEYPHSFTPAHGYLLTANQDPGGLESDGDLFNDPWHIGGPWDDGYRAEAIDRLLAEATVDGSATLADMSAIQGHHVSSIGRHQLDVLLSSVARITALTDPAPDSSDARALAAYQANQARIDEAVARLTAWGERGWHASSGVETFYEPVVTDTDRDDAVATTVFNVWLGDLIRRSIDDEGFPGNVFQSGGAAGRLRILDGMLRGRGPGNPRGLASWDPEVEESVFWDELSTPEREESDEVLVLALIDALDFLASPGSGDEGGFGTDDMDAWLWGLRHQVEFQSLVVSYIDDPLLGPLFQQFAITTDTLPLADSVLPGDPRRPLDWFPRPGDNRSIDAANPGLSGRSFRHGSGPVMRMVFALGDDGVEGVNVIPGGQSGVVGSPFYADQAELWLANETTPVPFSVEEVIAAAEGRTAFAPR